MNSHWLLRAPFAAVFLYHGMGKLIMPAMSAEMLSLPVALILLVGLAEVLAGFGAVAGGFASMPKAELITRLSGLAAAPVLVGAIAMVHFPRWSFVPTETHPMGGMEFQVVLLGLALYFLAARPAQATNSSTAGRNQPRESPFTIKGATRHPGR